MDGEGATLYIGNYGPAVSAARLSDYFGKFGEIAYLKMLASYSFLTFKEEKDAIEAVRLMDDICLPGERTRLRVELSRRAEGKQPGNATGLLPTRTLFVGGFNALTTKEADLLEVFSKFPGFERVRFRGGYSFVLFDSPEQAQASLEETNGSRLGDSVLSVEFSRTQQPREHGTAETPHSHGSAAAAASTVAALDLDEADELRARQRGQDADDVPAPATTAPAAPAPSSASTGQSHGYSHGHHGHHGSSGGSGGSHGHSRSSYTPSSHGRSSSGAVAPPTRYSGSGTGYAPVHTHAPAHHGHHHSHGHSHHSVYSGTHGHSSNSNSGMRSHGHSGSHHSHHAHHHHHPAHPPPPHHHAHHHHQGSSRGDRVSSDRGGSDRGGDRGGDSRERYHPYERR